MTERLKKREETRLALLEERKKAKESGKVESENVDFIIERFNKYKTDIMSKINNQITGDDLNENNERILNEAMEEYNEMKEFINESKSHLSSYYLRVVQEGLSLIKNNIDDKKKSVTQKSKILINNLNSGGVDFGRSKNNHDSAMQTAIEVDSLSFYGLKNISSSESPLRLMSSDVTGRDIQLDNITGCVIQIFGASSSLHISNLINCKVFSGPVSSSIFIDNCTNCTFQLACQQLRIHTSTNCDFYIHVTSKAIIEDSNNMRFGKYYWNYDSICQDFKFANLNTEINNWNKIDDFNWLSTDPSPNWSLI